ncbi:hypothetical protein T310_0484 [Rasamsonia emersonii CBS 393.64]|uniref:Rhodopsin domain-containing protein n=1 Tax=Rasamsonia emersonii (strain ATCC 16479 / CBS 393.64 / IMI 116815) TaxID=1408163 RepID=A0A0F4Z540_RASE3|nr:hypothetical protein T310_0484 [Rasamsonia emersonii CBS 393.64]KKA25460.1 hypothetical protein T310_0484 [Rasamsonia emersonii CBS 393.64]
MAEADVESFTLMSLGLVIILIRIYVRWTQVGPANFQLDDYLMPLAGMVFTGETVAAYLVGAKFNGLTNSYMTPEQRAALSPDSKEYYDRVWGSKIQVIGWSLYACILWLIKFCVAIFYSRLTTGLLHFETRVRISYVLLGVTYIAVALSILLGCQPMRKYWQINPDPGNLCQPTISKLYVLIVVIPNVLTDLYLLSIPLPITLMALFSGAAFVIMAGIIRAVVILKSGPDGAVAGSQWACRETFVSIVVSNLPIIQPLIRKGAVKIGLSALFSSYVRTSQKNPLSSKEHQSGHELRKRNPHPLSIPKGTAWGSDEHILEQGENNGQPEPSKEITVIQETVIESEPWPTEHPGSSAGAQRDHWERTSDERDNAARNYQISVSAGSHPR